ncbi:hypothetical protein Cantr_05844 [Candida viswanathii]|uniref:Uncharacterized protein n=1 Tax=Candida viswanathii TaxID=5486 RepID=A0A367XTB2_9ASCO|nr:hypothetical protein Cantr_05844 [Candida viswanathii]
MLRPQLIPKRTLFTKYTHPPRASYIANETYPQLFWNNVLPAPLKLVPVVAAGILTFINTHPKYYVSLGPPLGVFGYFGYARYRRHQYAAATSRLDVTRWEDEDEVVRLAKYDETSVANVLAGVDNSYDSIRRQAVQVNGVDDVTSAFVLENDQFSVNIPESEVESWLLLRFIKFSVAYYDSKNVDTRKRLGVVLVYLLELPGGEGETATFTDYKIGIEITPVAWVRPKGQWDNGK